MTAARTRTVALLRVSTDRQADSGQSLDVQRQKVKEYARLYNLDLVTILEDAGYSGRTLKRPGLQKALRMLDSGKVDALLVSKLDRLTRSVKDLGDLIARYFGEDKHVLLSVGEQIDTRSASGRLVVNLLTSVAQWERERITERICEAMAHKASKGEYLGGEPPYGWRVASDGVRLVEVPKEQAIIDLIKQLRGGGASLRGVAVELHRLGHRPRKGKRWHPTTISRILQAHG